MSLMTARATELLLIFVALGASSCSRMPEHEQRTFGLVPGIPTDLDALIARAEEASDLAPLFIVASMNIIAEYSARASLSH